MSKKNHRGSNFRDFLKEKGVLDEVETRALKQVANLQLKQNLKVTAPKKLQSKN